MEQLEEDQLLMYLVANLNHKSPSMRRRTIGEISEWLQQQNNSNISQMFVTELSAQITDLILDHSESVREAALHLLLELNLRITSDIAPNLNMKYIASNLTVIWEQLGCDESMCLMMAFKDDRDTEEIATHKPNTPETSEEIRILIVELLSKIISNNYNKFMTFCENNDKQYCFQYLNILHLLFTDKCPDIRRNIAQLLLNQIEEYETCTIAKESRLFRYIFDDYSEYLCLSLSKGCMQQRGKIRLISFQLLSKIIEYNIIIKRNMSAWITEDDKMWKYISYLTFDQMQYIKEALVLSGFKWISLLTTNAKKNGNNMNAMQYAKIWMLMLNEYGLHTLIEQQQSAFNTEHELLQCISFIVLLCTQKINHWQSMHRLFGIKALVSLTLCLKSKLASKYVRNLLPNFIHLIECQNDEIVIETNKCLKLFGKFIPIHEYSHFLLSKFNDDNVCIKSYLKLSAQIFAGYNVGNAKDNKQSLVNILKSLSNSSFQQNNKYDVSVGQEFLNATLSLLAACNQCGHTLNSESVLEILWLILNIHAGYIRNNDSLLLTKRLSMHISNIMKLLVNNDNINSGLIWQQYFKQLSQRIVDNYYLYGALLHYSTPFISKYMHSILPILQQCNNENNMETIRYDILSFLHSLIEETINTNDWQTYTHEVVLGILLPNIVWKVGKFQSKMRLLSLQCMLILYKNNRVDPNVTWEYRKKLISTLKSRLDDFECEVRILALQLFDYILNSIHVRIQNKECDTIFISNNELELLCQSLLDGFDDSKDEIRMITCSTLQSLIKCMVVDKHNIELYINIIQTSLLHLDDSNHAIQQRVFLFLKDISHFNGCVFHKQLKSANTDNIQNVSQALMQQLSKTT